MNEWLGRNGQKCLTTTDKREREIERDGGRGAGNGEKYCALPLPLPRLICFGDFERKRRTDKRKWWSRALRSICSVNFHYFELGTEEHQFLPV